MGGTCSTNVEKRNVYNLLLGKPEGRGPLERPRCRWLDNIKVDLEEIVWVAVDWIVLSLDRDRWSALMSAVMNHRVP
jgi:hypothetical protein